MTESPRELAAKIAENQDPWADVDAIIVANAYIELHRQLAITVSIWNVKGPIDPARELWAVLCENEAGEEPAA